MKACIHRIERQPRHAERDYKKSMYARHLTALLSDGSPCYDDRHGNNRQALGSYHLWAHPENYAPTSATH